MSTTTEPTADEIAASIDFDEAPRHADGYRRYVVKGYKPGHFLTAVLANELDEAVFRADMKNLDILKEHVMFVYWELPASCWGSREAVEEWTESGGLRGKHS